MIFILFLLLKLKKGIGADSKKEKKKNALPDYIYLSSWSDDVNPKRFHFFEIRIPFKINIFYSFQFKILLSNIVRFHFIVRFKKMIDELL